VALVDCPECNRQVSDRAATCIHCGYPLRDELLEQKMREVLLRTLDVNPKATLQDVLENWKTVSGPDIADEEVGLMRAVYEQEMQSARQSPEGPGPIGASQRSPPDPRLTPQVESSERQDEHRSSPPVHGGRQPAQDKEGAPHRWLGIPGLTPGRPWRTFAVFNGYLVLLSSILAGPIGAKLLAAAVLVGIFVAANAWALRDRLPGFKSEDRRIVAGSWIALVAIAALGVLLFPTAPSDASTARSAAASNSAVAQGAGSAGQAAAAASSGVPPEAQEHFANAKDHSDAGRRGLAIIEVDQAVAMAPRFAEAQDLQKSLRAEATAEVAQVRAQQTATARQAQDAAEAERRAVANRQATATATAKLLGTRQVPIPLGEVGAVEDKGSKLGITVAQVERRAWGKLRAANQFNTAPPAGNDYILVALAVRYLSGPEDKPYKLSDSHEFYAGNKLWGAPFTNVAPKPAFGGENLFPGATYGGWLDGKYLPTELQEEAVLVYKGVYFALK
jgi:hypothetical protein